MSDNRLIDQFGRRHEYLRISVTDRCNLRCRYCLPASFADQRNRQAGMPAEGIDLGPKSNLLTFDEIERLTRIFLDLGIHKVRITGGEPLVRNGIEELCERLTALPGLQTLALSTNAVLLEEKAEALRAAGVDAINISLDTLRRDRFREITFRDHFDDTLRGIEAAKRAKFSSIKINTVVIRGFNDDELLDFVQFAIELSLPVRFIEYMPFLGNRWKEAEYVPFREMFSKVTSQYRLHPLERMKNLRGPATEYLIEGSDIAIGFIPTMSEPFCGDCNRLRLTADGKMRTCLFARDGLDLRRMLRSGAGKDQIEGAIRLALQTKWEQHPEANELEAEQNRPMVAIGG